MSPAEGKAKAAPTLSCILGGGAIWGMESGGGHAVTHRNKQNNKDEYADGMGAMFQQVVNGVWCREWKEIFQSQLDSMNCNSNDEYFQ